MNALAASDPFPLALAAARLLCSGDPHCAEDRARFRTAKQRLASILPDGESASDHILRAVRWQSLNDIAGAFAGINQLSRGRDGETISCPGQTNE